MWLAMSVREWAGRQEVVFNVLWIHAIHNFIFFWQRHRSSGLRFPPAIRTVVRHIANTAPYSKVRVGHGRRCGLRRLARHIDVYVDESARIKVGPGQRVQAGQDVLATLVRKSTATETT